MSPSSRDSTDQAASTRQALAHRRTRAASPDVHQHGPWLLAIDKRMERPVAHQLHHELARTASRLSRIATDTEPADAETG
jgi:hypothetical protein